MPEPVTRVDFTALTAHERYKLMASLIVPRPIALVTTVDRDGAVNAAPFSMFAMVGEDPPLVMISVNTLVGDEQKDTARNIDATSEFVVHITDEPMAEKMHRCSEAMPRWQSELDVAGLTPVYDTIVAAPRIAEAPVAFECRLYDRIETASRQIYFGEITTMHARADLVDTGRWRVHLHDFLPIGRFGASFYVGTKDRFALDGDRSTNLDTLDALITQPSKEAETPCPRIDCSPRPSSSRPA